MILDGPPVLDGVARYVIVGAGSAGSVLADRLSAATDGHVVLIEAGGPDRRVEISIPAAFPKLFGSSYDWDYRTVPQPGLDGRALHWPRGKTLGGSSSLNAQIWTRGHRADYDGWVADGCVGWGMEEVLPYFRRAEDRAGAPSGYGVGGPIRIEDLRDPSPATADFLTACAETGLGSLDDGDSVAPEGAGPIRATQRNGRRWSAADAYIRPASRRENLTIATGVHVRRVIIEDGRAIGIEYESEQDIGWIRVSGEVILAAGAIASPQLLMLSGIGDATHLEAHGVRVHCHSPSVGRGLSDHLYVPLAFAANGAVSPGVGDLKEEVARYTADRRGRLTSNIAEALAFLRSDETQPAPDLEFVWMLLPFLDQRSTPDRHGVTLGVVLLSPRSRGRISLRAADAIAPPAIDPGYLSDPEDADLRTLEIGVGKAREVLRRPVLSRWLAEPLTAGALDDSPEAVRSMIRSTAETLYHPVGTCGMGPTADAVLDLEFRVRGTQGLRVVDASAIPSIPRAHTHAPTVMLAERAADLILANPPARSTSMFAVAHSPLNTDIIRGEVAQQ